MIRIDNFPTRGPDTTYVGIVLDILHHELSLKNV